MRLIFILCLLQFAVFLSAVNVHGHITSDTEWTADNNPYIVDGFLYVDANVTLTIRPGVQVLVKAADASNWTTAFRWHIGNPEIQPKLIFVYGEMIAIGTPESPILFDRYEDNPNWRWCGLTIMDDAPKSTFAYCTFNNTYLCEDVITQYRYAAGAILFKNGKINVSHCTFLDNEAALCSENLSEPLVIPDCTFNYQNTLPNSLYTPVYILCSNIYSVPPDIPEVQVAKCTITGRSCLTSGDHCRLLFLFCRFVDTYDYDTITGKNITQSSFVLDSRNELQIEPLPFPICYYGNYYHDHRPGLTFWGTNETDTLWVRRNVVYQPTTTANGMVEAGAGGTVIVADNKLFGCTGLSPSASSTFRGYFYNNEIITFVPGLLLDSGYPTGPYPYGVHIFNNIFVSLDSLSFAIDPTNATGKIYHNTFHGFHALIIGFQAPYILTNNVVSDTDRIGGIFDNYNYPVFINNCLPDYTFANHTFTDGGGNIVADPMFVDAAGGDFNLLPGSPCIDSGVVFDDMPVFDAHYNRRMTYGVPDMGALEYNSQYIGGISGFVYDTATGLPVNCARISIQGKLPEFSDSLGLFVFPTGPGTYTITVKRWDYDDVIIRNFEINVGGARPLSIGLNPAGTAIDNPEAIAPVLKLSNSPNPFNLQTILHYELPKTGVVNLGIYNLKGQKVKTLVQSAMPKGHSAIIWNGKNEQNNNVASGVYFARLQQGSYSQTIKMLLLK
jgi:hypothetical protein